jgi:dipicolinate synthase subunit A
VAVFLLSKKFPAKQKALRTGAHYGGEELSPKRSTAGGKSHKRDSFFSLSQHGNSRIFYSIIPKKTGGFSLEKKENLTVGIIGGDKRQEYMVQLLKERNIPVLTYAVSGQTYHAGAMKELMKNSTVLVAPVPFTRNGKSLFSVTEKEDLDIDSFLSYLRLGHILCGGSLPNEVLEKCREIPVPVIDFLKNENIAKLNAVATAEGALMEACRLSPFNFHQNKSIVIGYGKCGSVLADRLKGLCSDVTVCARRKEARTQARTMGLHAVSFEELKNELKDARFLFNTVPSLVITKEHLELLHPLTVIVDIASFPGGVDYPAAGALGITSSLFLSIPGKTAPYSSAMILTEELIQSCHLNSEAYCEYPI